MKKRILIVEDNFIIAEDIKYMLQSFGYFVVAIVDKAEKALSILKTEQVDLIIIDIIIKGDLSGIDFAEIVVANYNIPFIYLTSNSDKATIEKAIQFKPKAYIVKPFVELDIFTNVRLALEQDFESSTKKIIPTLIFKVDGLFVKILASEILFVKSDGNYVRIRTINKEYLTRMSFKELLLLVTNFSFSKIHKSYVVNLANVVSFGADLVVIDGHKLPLGRSYKKAFISAMQEQKN